jgi:hypothetical protein
MPVGVKGFEAVVDYHQRGFARLAGAWTSVRQTVEAANVPHEFVTFHTYEAHSRQYGDYYILSPSPDLPILEIAHPAELIARLAPTPAIAVPHHVAYAPGYRGINWQAYSAGISPIVEVYSKHGSGMSDQGPYPYLDSMGPRDSRNTIRTGMALGHRFGFVASTDHHAGYPGSYSDGRLAVWAAEKTRQAIWEAILARRTYAVTGDKIRCRFQVNDAIMGSEAAGSGPRHIELNVAGCDPLDRIIVYKNSKPWQVLSFAWPGPPAKADRFKVRIEMGWGRSENSFLWQGELEVRDGAICSVEPCFRGRSVLEPTLGEEALPDANKLDNRIVTETATTAAWRCTTFKNLSPLHPQTASLIFELEGNDQTSLRLRLNGKQANYSIRELLRGGLATHLQEYASEAFLVHRAVPDSQYCFNGEWRDPEAEAACDTYDVEIRQVNSQYAWLSPVFILG